MMSKLFKSALVVLGVMSMASGSPTLRLVNGNLAQNSRVDHGVALWIDGVGNFTHDRFGVDRTMSGQSYLSDLQELGQASNEQLQSQFMGSNLDYSGYAQQMIQQLTQLAQMFTGSTDSSTFYQQLAQLASGGNIYAQQQLAQMTGQTGYSSDSYNQLLAQMAQGNMYGNSMYGNGMYGNNMYGNNMYGNSMYGNSMYGNSMYGNGLYDNSNTYDNGLYSNNNAYGNNMYDTSNSAYLQSMQQQLLQQQLGGQTGYGIDNSAYSQLNAAQFGQQQGSSGNGLDSWSAYLLQQQLASQLGSNYNMFGQQGSQIASSTVQQVAEQAAQMASQLGSSGINVASTASQMTAAEQIAAAMAQNGLTGTNSLVNNGVTAAQEINQLAQNNLVQANALSTQL